MKRILCMIVVLWGCNLNDNGRELTPDMAITDSGIAVCNNGIQEIGEQCDSDVPEGKSCESVGFRGGVALCNAQCELDYSNCADLVSCGNGELDEFEQCDPGLPNEETCLSRGYEGGAINCAPDCTIDDSDCSIVCGNDKIAESEICDGNNVGNKTCATENGEGWIGALKCDGDCFGLDSSECYQVTPQIVSAREFNCRLKSDGKVDCWNAEDLLPNDGTYVKISTGSFHVCGLKSDGLVECWGENSEGQIDAPDTVFKDVIADGRYSCGLTLNGTIQCWGKSTEGQTTPPQGEGYQSLSGGKQHACAIDPNGAIQCWGTWNGMPEFLFFEALAGDPVFESVTSGRYYDCGLDKNREPKCWSSTRQTATKPGPFVKLSTNTFHTCGLRIGGEIDCWGETQFGKADSRPGPFIDVSTGFYHTCGLKADLSVECWGINPNNIDASTVLFYKGQTTARPAPDTEP